MCIFKAFGNANQNFGYVNGDQLILSIDIRYIPYNLNCANKACDKLLLPFDEVCGLEQSEWSQQSVTEITKKVSIFFEYNCRTAFTHLNFP